MVDDNFNSSIPMLVECDDGEEDPRRPGFTLGGIAGITDPVMLARSFKCAADCVVNATSKGSHEAWEVGYPVLFLYRHAIELYLKTLTRAKERRHDIKQLVEAIEQVVVTELRAELPKWVKSWLMTIHEIDPTSTALRYVDGQGVQCDEKWVDLCHIQAGMDVLFKGFEQIRLRVKSQRPVS